MKPRMSITLTGTIFTDTLLADVGVSAFSLDHDWFTRQDLVIRTAASGGGTLLVEDTDYTLGIEDTSLSARVTAAVGSGRNVFKTITIINAAYQTGNLYFSGKYIADALDPAKQPSALVSATTFANVLCQTLPPFVPVGIHKGFVAALGTARVSSTTTSTSAGKLVDTAGDFVTNGITAGDWIYNSTDGTWGRVTARDSATQLSVDNDVFPTSKAYKIYPTPTWPENILECDGSTVSDAESPINGMKLPSLNAAGSYADNTVAGGMHLRGGTTAGVVQEDQMQGHHHLLAAAATGTVDPIAADNYLGRVASDYNLEGTSTAATMGRTGDSRSDAVPNGTPRTGKETRPRSMSVVYIMRIK